MLTHHMKNGHTRSNLSGPLPPIDTQRSTLVEVHQVLGKFRSGNACQSLVKLLKAGGNRLLRQITAVFASVRTSSEIPSDSKLLYPIIIFVLINKQKDDPKDCVNYRCMFSLTGNEFVTILLYVEFTSNRLTVD